MKALRDATPVQLADYGWRSPREARVTLRRHIVWFARHARQDIERVKLMPGSEFRALLRELHELVSEEWAPET